ncbi:MAG: hypothetical protein QOG13_1417 [Sphingomonadales bacterium]|jgi:hypothetical protein|nr:hypothetical protein [Sphingomonadales bacterium]
MNPNLFGNLLRVLPAITALIMSSCSAGQGQIAAVKNMIATSAQLSSPSLLILNTGDEGWVALTRARQRGGFLDAPGCSVGENQIAPILPEIRGYSGTLRVNNLVGLSSAEVGFRILYDNELFKFRTAHLDTGNPDIPQPRVYHCQALSNSASNWVSQHADISTNADGHPAIVFGRRSDLQFQFENRYETELPGRGRVPVVALQFTYKFTPTLSGLTTSGQSRGTGRAKALLDGDTGQWTFVELVFQDPDVTYQANLTTVSNIEPVSIGATH